MFRRYELLQQLVPKLTDEYVVCNLGFPAQELYALGDSPRFFYMLGSMGLASSIGLGLSLQTVQSVVALDGDGSVLMNLGTLSTIARFAPPNYRLIIIDNGAYSSTGDQPTHTAAGTSLAAIARAAGIDSSVEVAGDTLADTYESLVAIPGPHVIVAKVDPGSPKLTPIPLSALVIRERFREAFQ